MLRRFPKTLWFYSGNLKIQEPPRGFVFSDGLPLLFLSGKQCQKITGECKLWKNIIVEKKLKYEKHSPAALLNTRLHCGCFPVIFSEQFFCRTYSNDHFWKWCFIKVIQSSSSIWKLGVVNTLKRCF